MNFCPRCGARIRPTGDSRRANHCAKCGAALEGGSSSGEPGLIGHFPFKLMRPSQERVLGEVEKALSAGKKFIILEAPVGFGKSAIAASLCNYLGSAYLLTSTKQLQDQYSADFGFPIVMGKSNFTCLVPASSGKLVACSRGRCEADWTLSDCPHFLSLEGYEEHRRGACKSDSKCRHLKENKLCPYYDQKWEAFYSPTMVANYPFFLSELSFTDDVRRRKLLVCDEAHDLEKQMVSFASFTLRRSLVESFATSERDEARFIPDRGVDDASAWQEPLLGARETLQGFIDAYMRDASAQDRVASCRTALDSLDGFVEDLKANPANWIVNSVTKEAWVDGGSSVEEVVFQPLEIGAYTSQLFASSDTVLLMSATVFSQEVFCRTLGIHEEDAAFIQVKESSFPVENRRVFALDTAWLNRSTMESSLELVAMAVDGILNSHAGERGVVHTTSYFQARYILEHVSEANRKRLSSTEGASSRSALLKVHGLTDESVLISPSLYQGVDLKDELSRFQVLVKVPFPDLSERRTRVKLGRDPGWYDWQTALRLVQTYGRSVRSETDHAVTYVLDSNFTSFVRSHRQMFPQYFLEALGDRSSIPH